MIIKLSKSEQKTLSALDPKGKGQRPWQSAREVGSGVYKKAQDKLSQEEIRVVRNAFRKIVREGMVEMSTAERGKYRITDFGRKLMGSGDSEFEGRYERGEATKAAKIAGEERLAVRPKASKAPKEAKKKATKKKASKKKKTAKTAAAPKKGRVKVVDKTDGEEAHAKGSNGEGGANGERKKPKFKRRQALKYANSQSGE